MNSRIGKIRARLKQENLDGLIVSWPANISYLTDFTSRDSYLVVSKRKYIYITDSRYTEEAKRRLKGFVIKKVNGSVFRTIADACKSLKLKTVGFEERYLSCAEYKKIKEELGQGANLVSTHRLVEELRQVKTAEESGKIKRAVRISIKAINFAKEFISPGKREIEVAAEIERFIRYRGARGAAFDIIVASGPNSSYPHHITSARKIRKNEPVLIDIGVDYMGYKSDLTRVFFLGKINSLTKKIYNTVLKAQESAIKKIKPGIFINKIDTAARQYIAQRGYGGFFGHNLGHGVGLEVHEEPHISGRENGKLKAGMVFTVEPGIYLPGKFGIRIEDMALVTGKGVEILSGSLDK